MPCISHNLVPITILGFSDFRDTCSNLKQLLLLPTKLEHSSFRFMYSNMTQPWNLSVMGSALTPHKSTLRALAHSSLCEMSLECFDLTDFTSLEELKISSLTGLQGANLATRLKCSPLASGSSLGHFISMTGLASSISTFKNRRKNGFVGSPPLQRIQIIFNP
ncbi:hypothetical protein B0H67DRAFT_346505, partial [Lasiosphaeris hirsuta]